MRKEKPSIVVDRNVGVLYNSLNHLQDMQTKCIPVKSSAGRLDSYHIQIPKLDLVIRYLVSTKHQSERLLFYFQNGDVLSPMEVGFNQRQTTMIRRSIEDVLRKESLI